ncbi:Uncharacterised protein [Klebsiella pneumoniae]|uniref:Uncharacterized protein n=1 Tax=Klebsiella pneumoniae TaxID=573 RepID=A0A2X3HAT9_KLEPN|nr:Uncharacterised protein [Klebsiella pneumoniae]
MTQPQVRQQRFGDGALAAGSHRHRATAVPCLNHLNQRNGRTLSSSIALTAWVFSCARPMWIEIGLVEFDNRLAIRQVGEPLSATIACSSKRIP